MSASEIFNEFVIVLDKIDKIGVDMLNQNLLKLVFLMKKLVFLIHF